MSHPQWLHSLLIVSSPSRKDRRRLAKRSRKLVHLRLESLEDRITPSGGDPTQNLIAGSYTDLVKAVGQATAANTEYTIQITNNFTFDSGGQVTISKLPQSSSLTIEGQNGNPFTLTGNGNRLFDIEGSSKDSESVTFKDLVLTGGGGASVSQGGAIKDKGGNVTLSGVTVKSNTVTGGPGQEGGQGGGVYVSGGSSLSVLNSLIANNRASAPAGSGEHGEGGGVFFQSPVIEGFGNQLTITDSTLSGNTATGAAAAPGTSPGSGFGGGLDIAGSDWTATLKGDMILNNAAIGGSGVITAGAFNSGQAFGGGLLDGGNGSLTIVNDLAAPIAHPSLFLGNTAEGGSGAGGPITGGASGGAVKVSGFAGTTTVNIGNTTFLDNSAIAVPGGAPGATTGFASGGALDLEIGGGSGGVTMVNCTVAKNTASGSQTVNGNGGGISTYDQTTDTFANNTITQNTAASPSGGGGGGMTISSVNGLASQPILINNVIQGNAATTGADLQAAKPLNNATNNFITHVAPANAVNPATNIVGNTTPQLGALVGVNGNGNPTGGPIYYPLASGVASIGAGTTSIVDAISSVEGITPALDEIGDLRTSNGSASGSISLGAVQPLAAGAPLATTVVPGNASLSFSSLDDSPPFTITVAVNTTTGGTASGGTVSIYLNSVNNNPPTLLGTATVGVNGLATVSVPGGGLPTATLGGLPTVPLGNNDLFESYSGNASFDASTATGTLNVSLAPTSVVPGNATVNSGSTSPFAIGVGVNTPNITAVVTGNVFVSLVSGNTTTQLGEGAVTAGIATVNVTGAALNTIAALTPGTYQLIELYTDILQDGPFADSTANGTLTVTTAPTTLVPGNAITNLVTTSPFTIPVSVNSPDGTVSGNVTISLVSGNTTALLTPATGVALTGGTANVSVTLPAGLATGTYQLVETYLGNGQFAGSVANGALSVVAAPTSINAGNADIGAPGGTTSLPVVVNSSASTVSNGMVTIAVVSGGATTVIGSAPVSGGSANVPVSIPALPAGTYQLVETFTDSTGHFASSSVLGTLTVEPLPPQVASLELALDAAALSLLGNPGALMELQLFADVFLHYHISLSISDLMAAIQSLYPQTDGLGLSAIGAGMFFAKDVQHDNPQS